jgi:hypothetical protein
LLRFIRSATALAVLAVGGTVALAVPAAAATCTRSGCTGKDPQSTRCSSYANVGATRYDQDSGAITTQFRYNNTCHAGWARITVDSFGSIWRRVYVREYTGAKKYVRGYSANIGAASNYSLTRWTKMLSLTNGHYYRACWRYISSSSGPAHGSTYCTKYVYSYG